MEDCCSLACFALKPHKPGPYHLHLSQHSYLPSTHNSSLSSENSMASSSPKLQILPQSSPKTNMVRSVSATADSRQTSLLVRLCHCDRHHDRKQLGEEKYYFTLHVIIHHQGCQGMDSNKIPGDGNWSRDHGRMLCTGLPSMACSGWFLIQSLSAC